MEIGNVITYWEMCSEEGASLQRGMNYKLHGKDTVILMSRRPNAPYPDQIEEDGKILIYEGHDVPRSHNPKPKTVDQEKYTAGKKTQNGLFYDAAQRYENGGDAEIVKVYEKVRDGIWTFNGLFKLVDSWEENDNGRKVFKFKLEILDTPYNLTVSEEVEPNRIIPPAVKVAVWKRDKGTCRVCGSIKNLHFDHIIPFSKGGSSTDPENIQILCAKCNLKKHDKIE